uniref:Uncharacterized protein n=1 Tax=Romanomermis culicivorax TaxID=13658 RepID=A0A915HQG5_ROMCU
MEIHAATEQCVIVLDAFTLRYLTTTNRSNRRFLTDSSSVGRLLWRRNLSGGFGSFLPNKKIVDGGGGVGVEGNRCLGGDSDFCLFVKICFLP